MTQIGKDSLATRSTLNVNGQDYAYYSLAKAAEQLGDISRLPISMKVLLENLLRFEDDGFTVGRDHLQAIVDWQKNPVTGDEIQYRPARVLLQDFTGVPCVVDLAAMRDAIKALGGDTAKINPQVPVDLVIDHSVMVDEFGHPKAMEANMALEYERNAERYDFLKWGSKSFRNFTAVPPGTGICHQVNLEYIGRGVWSSEDESGTMVAYPDTCVGTDSHTTMINGLGVLGWGVGGIEAEAAMLGQPISMLVPEVVGFKLTGHMAEGVTATDLVLTCVQMLREVGVVGRFVEFYGPGVANLTLADRATIANMAPEYGATVGFFGIDDKTIEYMRLTGRSEEGIALVEAYCKAQGLWFDPEAEPVFSKTLELDMTSVVPSLAGPKRPQDRVILPEVDELFNDDLAKVYKKTAPARVPVDGLDHDIGDGDVVIAAITSCTNTSNPDVLIAAGLVAKKANERGMKPKPWVKTSLAPGSQVVTDYLVKSGLQDDLNAIGFDLVGYGCTTCIGNSGPLAPPISKAINGNDIVAAYIVDAKPLAILGDSVTTDHISPAGAIKEDSPAGAYLKSNQVAKADFNSYGARRGNHDVMMRGTFANIRIKNQMVPGVEGGFTTYEGEKMPIYDAAMKHKEDGTPLIVVGGKEYGTGSSRDWAAKGTILLGVRAVIVESFERIHRSNLVGMGVLPLQFEEGTTRETLELDADCAFSIKGLADLAPAQTIEIEATRGDGTTFTFNALCRIDTANEMEYYRNGGILQYVLRKLAA